VDLRIADKPRQSRELVDRAMRQINTAIPGKIVSFDGSTQTATVQPCVKMRTFIDEEQGHQDPPQIINAPVVFPFVSTLGFALTLPISAGDPCLLIFSQRAIDNWHDQGGVQPPEEGIGSRHHDITDAFVLMAPSPKPNVLGAWQTDGIELRNRSRDVFLKITDAGIVGHSNTCTWGISHDGSASITAPGGMGVITPTATYSADIHAGGDVKAQTVSLYNHVHTDPQGGQTGPPVK
jgi:hypothetical protein